jgi:hypothetical protein
VSVTDGRLIGRAAAELPAFYGRFYQQFYVADKALLEEEKKPRLENQAKRAEKSRQELMAPPTQTCQPVYRVPQDERDLTP